MSDLTKTKEQLLREWLKESEQNLVVLVFSASWSGSAHILHTYVKDAANQLLKMQYHLIDIDQQPKLADHFGISNIPVCVIIKKREVVTYIKGMISKKKLMSLLLDA